METFLASKRLHKSTRQWHGSISNKISCIDNLVDVAKKHQSQWAMPPDMYNTLVEGCQELQLRISKCRGNTGSSADRMYRNVLFREMTDLCLVQIRMWAYGQYSEGKLTADEVHELGFLLPGETGGRHRRKEATDIVPEVKVRVINEDFIRVIIDHSAGENAALVARGWPYGVRHALIVVIAADGMTEIYRRLTTRLHTDIEMPNGSRGKQFLAKASFLRHVDDEPRFSNEKTFSMPLTTEDLAARYNK